jgi:MSHA biogenesis protein MshG
MGHFAFRARNAGGELVVGVLESADSGAAASQLFARGMTPVDITVTTAPAEPAASTFARLLMPKLTAVDLMLFSRQMHTLLKAGVPIMRALAGLQASTTNRTLIGVLQEVRDDLDAGRDLSASLAGSPGVFNAFYVSMVKIGETTGRLEEIFERLFRHIEFEKFMREQVRSAIRYPSFVVATMMLALVVINLFVIPAFAKVYKNLNADLPAVTRVLIGFSDFVVAFWPALLIGVVAAGFGFRSWSRSERTRVQWHAMQLRIPIAGKIVLKATLARFTRSFSLALQSGVPVLDALTSASRTVDNDFMAGKIESMREHVERGGAVLRAAEAAGIFTPLVLQMIAVGEESGALDDLMQEIGEMYQREVEYELKTLSSQIEPILIIALAVLVLILALGVFLPIWDLGRAMGK